MTPNGAVGVVGVGRIAGEIAAPARRSTMQDKFYTLISLLAGVNLLLFFFNLLPLLPLDGGHVAGALVEATKRGWARLRARGQPAQVGADGTESSNRNADLRRHRADAAGHVRASPRC